MPWANSLPNAQRFRAKRAADGPLKERAVSWRSWVAFAALGIMWGVPYYLIKVAVQELSPWVIAWGRVSLAACILLPIAWRRGALRSLGRHKLALFAFALVEFVVPLSASVVIASVVLLIPAALAMPGQLPAAVTLASIAILGVVCTAMAMLLMFYLVSNAGASRASLITYVNPAVATLLGVWLLHAYLGLRGITAFALILLGSWLATRGARQRKESCEALT